MKQALIYSLKICLTVVLLGPILYLFPYEHFHGNDQESRFIFLLLPIAMFMGCVCLLPYLLVLSFIVNVTIRRSIQIKKIKLLLFLTIVSMCLITYIAWRGWSDFIDEGYQFVACYALVALISVLLYKVPLTYQRSTEI
jgi:hypothetical protein